MSVPPTAEPTLWELQRALTQLREDQRDGIAQLKDDLRADLQALAVRLEQVVTKDVYQSDQRLLVQRIEVVERDLEAEARARADAEAKAAVTRRWLIGVFVAPIVVAALQLWLLSRGNGP
ncbi:hypothetical protein [Kitasatospora atroaurantiaca]|uniref:DUF1640 domain-containing protein n=1 Tax=Kitasatospora atroaurantiaca TaxID=285545 RepID=A0A561EMW2_9ACTN|nr:hypothetical protein [Kitasatospora atroaurantiaca]TWE16961.1 hypothetical protein FB465_1956 [Kitasatospora atroaurantiaca]